MEALNGPFAPPPPPLQLTDEGKKKKQKRRASVPHGKDGKKSGELIIIRIKIIFSINILFMFCHLVIHFTPLSILQCFTGKNKL